jgi:putative ABC transport system permease protein
MAALTLVDLLSVRVIETSVRDTRKFMGADFLVRSWREPPIEMRTELETLLARDEGSKLIEQKSLFASATTATNEVFNFSLSGSEPGFPLYGALIIETGQGKIDRPEIQSGQIFVDQGMKARGVKLGDPLRLGTLSLTVAGFIIEEPQSVNFLSSLGYRAIVSLVDLLKSGLIVVGARVSHRFLMKTRLTDKELRDPFRKKFPDKHWRLISVRQGTEQVARLTGILTTILVYFAVLGSLMGSLTAYFLFRIRIRKKLPELLTLKCLGLREESILTVNLVLFTFLALFGVLSGFLLGLAIEGYLVDVARQWFGTELAQERPWIPTFLRVLSVALLSVLWSTYFPLREVLQVPVNQIFSGNIEGDTSDRSLKTYQGLALVLLSFLFVVLFSSSFRQALLTHASLLFSVGAAFAFVEVILFVLKKIWRSKNGLLSFLLSRGILRHPLRTRIILVSLILGLVVAETSFFLSNSLRTQIEVARAHRSADLVLLVPDESQQASVEALRSEGLDLTWLPYSQARVYTQAGEPVREIRNEGGPQDEDEIGIREYFLNYRSEKDPRVVGEEVEGGRSIFGKPEPDVVRLSLEKKFSERVGLTKGDRLRIEIGGIPLEARIDSLRVINWFNFNPNFFIVAAVEDLEGAPRAWFGLSKIQGENIQEWQSRIVAKSPQTIALDSRAIAQKVIEILNKVDAAVYWVSIFLLLTLMVLIWGVTSGRLLDWPHEHLLFQSMGMRLGTQRQLLLMELLVLWVLALVVSLALSMVVAHTMSLYYFQFPMWWPSFSKWMQAIAGIVCLLGLSLFSLRRGLSDLGRTN